jgi:type IV pilus assembly protein PilE
MNKKYYYTGFTLIELMIVLIIIAILSTIGFPSYQEQVLKGRRSDAKNALHSVLIQQEKFYSQHGFYGSMSELVGDTSQTSAENYYTLTLTCSPNCQRISRPQQYLITANPLLEDSKCGSYSIDQAGTNSSNGSATNDYCW